MTLVTMDSPDRRLSVTADSHTVLCNSIHHTHCRNINNNNNDGDNDDSNDDDDNEGIAVDHIPSGHL